MTHSKSGHGEDLDHDYRIIFFTFLMLLFFILAFFYVIACLPSVAHAFVFPISRIIPCQNVGTCTVPEAHNPENITIVDLCEEDNSNNIGL